MGIDYRARSFSPSWVDLLRMNLAGGFISDREIPPFGTKTEAAANLDELLPPAVHPATGSLQPVSIGATLEETKPSEPSRQTGRYTRLGEPTGRNSQ